MASLLTPIRRGRRPADGRRRAGRAGRPLAPAQDRDLHRDGRRGRPAGPARRRAGSPAKRPHAGWALAVASTSAEPSVRAVLEHAVGADAGAGFLVFAGDVVPHKKPAPTSTSWRWSGSACRPPTRSWSRTPRTGCAPHSRAGSPAWSRSTATPRDEDFGGAALVVSSLGDRTASGRRCWPTPAACRVRRLRHPRRPGGTACPDGDRRPTSDQGREIA